MNDNTRGIMFMVLAVTMMLTSDTVLKFVAQDLPLFQIIFIRHLFMTAGLVALAMRDGAHKVRPSRRQTRLLTLRTLGECSVICFYMYALAMMPLGTATAIFQLQPLAVTLAAVVFLSQPIGPRRLIAIIIGFSGVLLIVRPGTEAFGPGAILVLLAVGGVCLRDISTRILGPSLPATMMAAIASAALLVLSLAVMLVRGGWAPVSASQLGLIFCGACFLLVGYTAIALAMRFGDIAAISPFRYVSLVVGLIYGFVIFGEVPDVLMLAGALIIVSTGIYTFVREHRASVQRVPAH
ncbi:DMT family transporter [Amaricoccus macauensis]|uniref:DMT family transporter n=1 Tax=Amaricoccus macauensis TaxID=57001 RepID=UPI003C7A9E65